MVHLENLFYLEKQFGSVDSSNSVWINAYFDSSVRTRAIKVESGLVYKTGWSTTGTGQFCSMRQLDRRISVNRYLKINWNYVDDRRYPSKLEAYVPHRLFSVDVDMTEVDLNKKKKNWIRILFRSTWIYFLMFLLNRHRPSCFLIL